MPTLLAMTPETELATQDEVSEEIAKIHAGAAAGDPQPRLDVPPYRSSLLRHPT